MLVDEMHKRGRQEEGDTTTLGIAEVRRKVREEHKGWIRVCSKVIKTAADEISRFLEANPPIKIQPDEPKLPLIGPGCRQHADGETHSTCFC